MNFTTFIFFVVTKTIENNIVRYLKNFLKFEFAWKIYRHFPSNTTAYTFPCETYMEKSGNSFTGKSEK